MNDQDVMGLLRENLERLDPAPATDPAMLAARRRALVEDTGTFLCAELDELNGRLDAIKREAAPPAPAAAPRTTRTAVGGTRSGSPNSGVGGSPVPPAPGQAAGERAGSAGHPPAHHASGEEPEPQAHSSSPLASLDRLMEAAGSRPGAGRPRMRTGSGRLGWRAVTACIVAGLGLGLLLCAAAVTAWLYLP